MKRNITKSTVICLFCLITGDTFFGCKKLIAIDEPINTLTTTEVFSTDATATTAMAGVYSIMINGIGGNGTGAQNSNNSQFSAGLTTYLGGVSSDELSTPSSSQFYLYSINHLSAINSPASLTVWTSAYTTIYRANSIIEGIAASKSAALHDSVRNELTNEAKFVRAFSYFYLTNFFGAVPMALTVDFNNTQTLPRMQQQQVYQQIITDLKAAAAGLPGDYAVGKGERIVPNKWAATLMLARAYLYTGDYPDAATCAAAVINNNNLFHLEPDLKQTFLTTSQEAIWQLKQTNTDGVLQNATPEGYGFIPNPISTGPALYYLTNQLLSVFESGDRRKTAWVDSTNNSYDPITGQSITPFVTYYPTKYTIGAANSSTGQPAPQYYIVLRLAEAYLIRAEAEANGAAGGAAAAIADLNIIRNRAGLPNLTAGLDIKAAVAQENRIEFFAEWGHRWFDLKRTGKAHSVLSVIPLKQPWAGDYQLLYPIPTTEITVDHFLTQNPGY